MKMCSGPNIATCYNYVQSIRQAVQCGQRKSGVWVGAALAFDLDIRARLCSLPPLILISRHCVTGLKGRLCSDPSKGKLTYRRCVPQRGSFVARSTSDVFSTNMPVA